MYYRNPSLLFAKSTPDFFLWGIGDSQMDGRGSSIHTIASGVLDKWNGSAFTSITTQTCCNDGSDGSVYQYFAETYKANTGSKTVLVNSAKGGSGMYNQGGGIKYWTGGGGADDLWAPALTNVQAALTNKGLTKPHAIFLSIGHVDARDAVSDANMSTAMNTILTNITTAFPGVPILMLAVGRLTTTAFDVNLYNVRKRQVEKAEAFTDVHIVTSGVSISLITGGTLVDDLHFDNNGLSAWAAQLNRWFTNSSITNKWSRSVISSMYDDLSTARKGLINTVVAGLHGRGDLFELEHLSLFKQTVLENIYVDWTFLGYNFANGSVFTANTSISTNGSSTYHSYTFFSNLNIRAASATDFIEGVKIKTKTTANGVVAVALGASISGVARTLGQSTTTTNFRANDATQSVGSEAGITANNVYATYRNGTTKGFKKNKTTDASPTLASTGSVSQFPRIGAQNSNGTIANYFGGTYEYVFAARFTTFDYDSFYDDMEALCTNW